MYIYISNLEEIYGVNYNKMGRTFSEDSYLYIGKLNTEKYIFQTE